jgi:hypothetical protein
MQRLMVLLLAGFLVGCMSAGPTAEQAAELKTLSAENEGLVQAHKITHVEAATRYNEAVERIGGDRLTERDRLLNAYRVALASQVDAGQITIEVAKYQWEQRIADLKSQDRAATAAALAQLGDSLQQTGAQMQAAAAAHRPINCNSMAIGATISTTCY